MENELCTLCKILNSIFVLAEGLHIDLSTTLIWFILYTDLNQTLAGNAVSAGLNHIAILDSLYTQTLILIRI